MKKSLIYFLFGLLLINTPAFCEEITNEQITNEQLQNITMPTDEEIMQTIKKFNFDKNQQEYLFKETKKRLEDMYSNQNFAPVLQGDTTLLNDSGEVKNKALKTKKYTSHGSLSRKRKEQIIQNP